MVAFDIIFPTQMGIPLVSSQLNWEYLSYLPNSIGNSQFKWEDFSTQLGRPLVSSQLNWEDLYYLPNSIWKYFIIFQVPLTALIQRVAPLQTWIILSSLKCSKLRFSKLDIVKVFPQPLA